MFLVRLIYASKVASPLRPDDVEAILNSARQCNAKLGVTGMLCFSQDYFLQCLEGSRDEVNAVYQRISKDTRHHNIVLLDYKEIAHREFGPWAMAYVPATAAVKHTILQYSIKDQFDPFMMSGESAQAFLLEMKSLQNLAVNDQSKVA